jgi:thioesterase domain-containing protein
VARIVPEGRPLYVLQDPGLDPDGGLVGSVREMAAEYVRQLKSVQESGPYHILGWSFGGVVVHEMAAQRRAAGEQVVLVVLDTYPRPQEAVDGTPETREETERRQALALEHARAARDRALPVLRDDEVEVVARVLANNQWILAAHEFPAFDGDMLLVTSTGDKAEGAEPAAAWRPYVAGKIADVRLDCRSPPHASRGRA